MTVVSISKYQRPSLEVDGDNAVLGSRTVPVSDVMAIRPKVTGMGLVTKRLDLEVELRDGDKALLHYGGGSVHEMSELGRELKPSIEAILAAARAARASEPQPELFEVKGTVRIMGQSFEAVRRGDKVFYTNRAGKQRQAVGPHARSFEAA